MGPCQNQKNIIDPETIIKSFGADAARWFVLSDSPPEKELIGPSLNSGFMENMPENMDFVNDHENFYPTMSQII